MTACSKCASEAWVPSSDPDAYVCLLCGCPLESPPEPLPLVVGSQPKRRLGRDASLRERIRAVLARGPLRRDQLYAAVGGGVRDSRIGDCLRALRHEGLVSCDRGPFRTNTWRLAAAPESAQAAPGGRGLRRGAGDDGEGGSRATPSPGATQSGPRRRARFEEVPTP